MGETKTFHCDRCLRGVKSKRDLSYFDAWLLSDIDKKHSGFRQPLFPGEVCKQCAEELTVAVREAWLAGRNRAQEAV